MTVYDRETEAALEALARTRGVPVEQLRRGLEPSLLIADERAAWEGFVHLPGSLTLEQAEAWWEHGEQPSVVIVSGAAGTSALSRAWWWLSWREDFRAPRWALYLAGLAAGWGVLSALSSALEAIA